MSRNQSDRDQFNPKFGIIWNPVPDTTLRGAVFRALKRTLITDQTLEPTQVAGFNQFFDDANATGLVELRWRCRSEIHRRVYMEEQSLHIGIWMVPFLRLGSTPGELDWNEKLFRAYLFWTPHKWLAFSAEYLYEKFERDERFAAMAQRTSRQIIFRLGSVSSTPLG